MIQWIQGSSDTHVSRYIECYWFIEKSEGSNSYAFPKLNPDAACHLILSAPAQTYRYQVQGQDDQGEVIEGQGSHWLFPHQQTFELDHRKPFSHLGIKFQIGALYALKQGMDQTVVLDKIESADIASLMSGHNMNGHNMKETSLIELARQDPQACLAQLDTLLKPWLNQAQEDKHSRLVNQCLPLLAHNPITTLGERLHCSQRTLERSFNRVTGLTLKQCQAMNKLERLLEYLYQRDAKALDWVEIAYQFGFSDQPHLIRHLKKQLGLTPKNYAQKRGFTIDVYGGVNT